MKVRTSPSKRELPTRPSPQHRAMVDLMSVGAKLNREGKNDQGAILLSEDDAATIETILHQLDAEQKGHELSVTIQGRAKGASYMRMSVRLDRHGSRNKYLNFSGNPLTFLTGTNVYGSPNLEKQIVGSITECLQIVEERSDSKIPKQIWKDVEARNIHLLMIEFATYTGRLANKLQTLNRWHYMYKRTNIWNEATQENVFLDQMLGLQHINTEWKTSFCLRKTEGQKTRKTVLQMMFYDKEQEMLDQATAPVPTYLGIDADEEADEYVPADIVDRLRVEISLHKPWLKNHDIHTLADAIKYVNKHYDGKWKRFIRTEINKVVDRACLIKMFTFDGEAVLDAHKRKKEYVPSLGREITTEAWIAMLEARLEHKMTTEIKADKIHHGGGKLYRKFLRRAARDINMEEVNGLKLDMRRVVST